MLDARAFLISTLPLSGWLRRRRGTPTRAPAPASASRASSSLGLPAAPPAATHLLRAPSFRRPLSSRRGEAPWEREAAGGQVHGQVRWGVGVVFSESTACRPRGPRWAPLARSAPGSSRGSAFV